MKLVKVWLMAMKTYKFNLIVGAMAMLVLSNPAAAQYVRKKVLPNYFIPAQEIQPKQEKLPPIKYQYGEDETIATRSYDNMPITKIADKNIVPQPSTADVPLTPDNSNDISEPTLNEVTLDLPDQSSKEIPDYQQKYQEYLRDIKKVAAGKKMPNNPQLQQDLAKMNSDERILIDQKFNAERDVIGDFKNALQQ